MRRSLGGLFLLAAAGFFALGASLFWMDRVVFTPSPDTDKAYAILDDENIREEIAQLVAQVDAPLLAVSSNDLADFIEQISRIRAGAKEMRGFIADAHAHLIGEREEPAVITGPEQVQLVRNELVALQPDITLPVEEVGSVSVVNTITRWTWIVTLGSSLLFALLGLLMRPEPGEATFAIVVGAGATAVGVLFFGYVIPGFVLPAFSNDTWMGLFPQLAEHRVAFTSAIAVGLGAVAAAVFFLTGGSRQRRGGSSPLSTSRYREQQRWTR